MIKQNGQTVEKIMQNSKEVYVVVQNGKIIYTKRVESGLQQMYLANSSENTPTLFKDLRGTNDGIVENAVFDNGALIFNGVNSIVEYNGIITPQYTLMGTMAIEHDATLNTARNPRFIDGTNNTYPGLYYRNVVSGTDRDFAYSLWAHGKDQALINPRTSPPDGELVHIAYFWTGTYFQLYINGVFRTQIATTVAPASRSKNWLGGSKTTPDRYLKGKICSFMRYDRVITPAEIMQNYIVDKFEFKIGQ